MTSSLLSLREAFLRALVAMATIDASLQQRNSNDVIEYRVLEQQPSNSLIGNVLIDSHMHSIYSAQTLVTFRFNVLSVTTASGSSATVSDDARSYFAIDSVSGLLRTSRTLDRETLCRPMSPHCVVQLDISVTPVQYFRVIRVIVHVDDLNDNAPVFDPSHVNLSIYELSTIGSRFPLPTAFDGDSSPFSVREYQMHSVAASHPFRLLEVNATAGGGGGDSGSELYLILVGRLDREMKSSYSLTLTARDGGIPPRTGVLSISIVVVDANDNPPVFDRVVYEFTLAEDTPIGMTVVKVKAFDADEADNSRLVYGLATSPRGSAAPSSTSMTSPSTHGPFAIDADTGHVVLVTSLDREADAELVIGIVATDSPIHGPSLSGYSRLVVKVTDVNDNAPAVTVHALTPDGLIQVSENSPAGSFVAHISSTDLDEGANGQVSCQLTAGMTEFQLIKIGDTEYKLVTGRQFDREEQEQYRVVVTCSDEGFPALYMDTKLNVLVGDENDCRPIFSSDTFHIAIAENGPPGQMLTQLYATDDDLEGPHSTLTYAIRPRTASGLPPALDIDPDNGTLWTLVSFDYEAPGDWPTEYIVTATDRGLPTPLTGTATLHVSVTDVQDNRPIFIVTPLFDVDTSVELVDGGYHFEVFENEPAGTVVGRLMTSDADDPPYDGVRYRLADSSESNHWHRPISPQTTGAFFTIDALTGDVTMLAPIDRESVDHFRFTAVAENPGFESTTGSFVNVTVRVLDVNDNSPVFVSPLDGATNDNSTTICSYARRGDWLMQLAGYDPDVGVNGDVWYQLADQFDEHTGNAVDLFYVSSSDGWLVASRDLSRETIVGQRFVLRIALRDRGSPSMITDVALTLRLDDSRCTELSSGGGGGLLYPQYRRSHWSRGAFVALVTVTSLSGAMATITIVSCLVLGCQRRRRRHRDYQTRSQIIGNAKYDQVSSMTTSSSAVTISRRRWTDSDRKFDSKHVLERLDRQQKHRAMMTSSSVADVEESAPRSRERDRRQSASDTGDDQVDQTVDRSRTCFNIQHEFEIVWKSSATASRQQPTRNVDTLPNLSARGQHGDLRAADSRGVARHYVRRHSTADGKDRWPYSDLLRHQLRQHDVTRLNRRPSTGPHRYELWSNESKQREVAVPPLCCRSIDDNDRSEQVLPSQRSTTDSRGTGVRLLMDPTSDSGLGPSEDGSTPSTDLSSRSAVAPSAVTSSIAANFTGRDCCLATSTAPRPSSCRHRNSDVANFRCRTPRYVAALRSPGSKFTDCDLCDLVSERPLANEPIDDDCYDDGRSDDVTTTSGSYVVNIGDLDCSCTYMTDDSRGMIV